MSGRLTIMRPKLFIAVAVISLAVAYPISQALAARDATIQSQQRENHSLKLQIEKLKAKPIPQPKPKVAISPPIISSPPMKLASFTCANYKNIFQQYNWNSDTAMAICQAESSGNPSAVSNARINYDGVSDFGLMQLHGVDILDPAQNIGYAYYHKYLTQGWAAWSTYNNGAYSKYL